MNHTLRLATNFLLWIAGLFFLLGATVFVTKALPAAIAMLILSLLLMPLSWRRIRRLSPKTLGRLPRFGLVVVAFIIAVALTPPTPESTSTPKPVAADATANTNSQSPDLSHAKKTAVTNKTESITDVFVKNGSYEVSGSGTANTDYAVKLPDGSEQKVKTGSNGEFTLALSKDTPVFGSMELVRDTNGWWFGGEKIVATTYYVLDKDNAQHSNSPLKPVIFGISDKVPYEISGMYTPGTQIVVRNGNTVLATTNVDETGRFKFANISLSTNFTPIAIFQRISTGWFSSKDTKISDDRYVDIQAHTLLASLPTYTKEVTVTQSIPFTEQSTESANLTQGITQVTQEGVNGSEVITYVVTYKGNDETGRQQKSEVITKQPVAKITTTGTYIAPAATPTPAECPNGTYTNSAGNSVCSPYASSSAPAGATAQCSDGTYSFSQSRSGTCSHHGGVASWL